MQKAVFLDRDGTINSDKYGYIRSPEQFKLFDFSSKAIKMLKDSGFSVFLVTNQSGIARGFFSYDDLDKIHQKMQQTLSSDNAEIDDIFISPFHKNGIVSPFNISHRDRKPDLGMFEKALSKYRFSIKNSFMIGDSRKDIIFGKNAGLKTILVLTGNGTEEFIKRRNHWTSKPDFIVPNLLSAAKLICLL